MPNANHFWTKDEEAAVLGTSTYEEFNRLYPNLVTKDAYRFRKAKLLRDQAADLERPATRVVERGFGPESFAGFTIGFFDIETTFSMQPRVLYAAVADAWGNVKGFDRDTYPGESKLFDDKELVEEYVKELQNYDILVGWNSKSFDIPVLNGRLAYHASDVKRVDPNMHVDLMWYATGQFMRIGRRSLESVSSYFGTDNRKTPLDVRTWDRAVAGDDEAYASIKEHCDYDVLVLRDVFTTLKPHVRKLHR